MGLEFQEFRYINTDIYPSWLELPSTGTNFHGSKPFQATEVLLYFAWLITEEGRRGILNSLHSNHSILDK